MTPQSPEDVCNRSCLHVWRWLLPVVLMTMLSRTSNAYYFYTVNSGTSVTITHYTGSDTTLIIPDTINVSGTDLPVIAIGNNAFYDSTSLISVTIPISVTNIGSGAFMTCANMINVTIPDRVTTIGSSAFSGCNKLASVTIPSSVTSIGSNGFSYCNALKNITIPSSVATVGANAFIYCYGLTSITVDGSNSFYCSVDGILFDKNQTTLMQYPSGKAGTFTIPASVNSIGSNAFSESHNLSAIMVDGSNSVFSSVDGVLFSKDQTSIIRCPCGRTANFVIPNTVSSIGSEVFADCRSLTNVIIPNTVTSILTEAFFDCASLTSVIIPASVTSIGRWTFGYCENLTNVYFMGNAPSVGTSLFKYTPSSLTVYYYNGSTGFSEPTWTDSAGEQYHAVNLGQPPLSSWLFFKGFPSNANLQSMPNNDGVPLLMSYALNLDPTKNQSANIPKPVVSGSQMSLTYFAGSSGVAYSVEACSDLQSWSTSGVTITGPDSSNNCTATVPIVTGTNSFMRLKVVY